MRTIFSLILLVIGVLTIQSCDDRDDNITGPNIRIQNVSNLNFTKVEIREETIFFENIASDSFSEYMQLDIAYPQDILRVEIGGETLNFVPETTEDPLPIGLYTYQLNVNEEGELVFTFKIDG